MTHRFFRQLAGCLLTLMVLASLFGNMGKVQASNQQWSIVPGTTSLGLAYIMTADSNGTLYLADPFEKKLFKLTNGIAENLISNKKDFGSINSIAVAGNGDIFIAEASKVKKHSNGNWTDITGAGSFTSLTDITVDASGNVYVVDNSQQNVKKLTNEGWDIVGGAGLSTPGRIAVDNSGNVYVADGNNDSIKKLSGGTWTSIYLGQENAAFDISTDSNGDLYVLDISGKKVKKLSGDTWIEYTDISPMQNPQGLTTFGSGNLCILEFNYSSVQVLKMTTTNNTPADAAKPTINAQPQSATVNVNDPSPVLSVDASANDGGTLTYQWYKNSENSNSEGTEIEGADEKNFSAPTYLAGTTYYYAVITNTNLNAGGSKTAEVKSEPAEVTVNQSAPPLTAPKWIELTTGPLDLSAPSSLAVDNQGTIYVVSTLDNKVKKLSDGAWQDITFGWEFSNPKGIATDADGNVYVADTYNHKIKKMIDHEWIDIHDVELFFPYSIAVDSKGDVYLVEPHLNSIKILSENSLTDLSVSNQEFSYPEGIAIDHSGTVYVTDTNHDKLKKLTGDGWEDITGSGNFNRPRGVAVDSKGALYVADTSNGKVKRLSDGAWTDISGTDEFTSPQGITVDSDDNIYVADSSTNRVKVLYYNAVKPTITTQPVKATAAAGETGPSLSAAATVADAGTLSYQWYSNSEESTSGGTPIEGATGSSYTVPTSEAGTTFYYVVVKNTNNSAFGDKTAEAASTIVDVTVTAQDIFTVTFNTQGGSPVPELTNVAAGGKLAAPTPPSKIGYTFQGWYQDAPGTIAWNFSTDTVSANITLYAKWTTQSTGGDPVATTPGTTPAPGSSPGTPSGGTSTPAKDEVTVLVGGKAVNGKTTSTLDDERKVTTLTLDEKQLKDVLAAAEPGVLVDIPVSGSPDVFIGELNGAMVKDMESKQAVLNIKTERVSYKLPARQIDMDSISQQIGAAVALRDIKVHIQIGEPAAPIAKAAEDVAGKQALTLVVPPIEFMIKATHDGSVVEVSKFNAYVERSIALPDGVDPNKITTGVVNDPDGTVRHVPTKVAKIGDKYYAQINSLTNSLYSVIWNPLEFKDVEGHWAQAAVNDMGSRLVIDGIGNGKFSPDADITRAEFAAIVVRGLGLKPVDGTSPFSDVTAADWYSSAVQTAYEYNLIEGFGDGSFHPNEIITREQAMVIMAQAMSITELQAKYSADNESDLLSSFVDSKEVANWAKEGVFTSLQAEIANGRSANALAPKASITRAEAAALMQRILKQSNLI